MNIINKEIENLYIKLIVYSFMLALPLLLWFKYVYNIEMQNLSEISYFDRF